MIDPNSGLRVHLALALVLVGLALLTIYSEVCT